MIKGFYLHAMHHKTFLEMVASPTPTIISYMVAVCLQALTVTSATAITTSDFGTNTNVDLFDHQTNCRNKRNVDFEKSLPVDLRDKILAFHRQLDAPDNFKTTIRPNAKVAAGLAEWTKEDDVVGKEDKDEVRGELQADFFRFSREVAIQAEERVRERDRKEWERLLKSRKVSRRLNKQLRKRFGHHKIKEEWSEEEIVAFRKMKRKLKKRIARRLRVKELEERRLYL